MVIAGSVLAGRYELERRIANGGMGEVWRAFDQVLGRPVAVKRLLHTLPDEPGFVDRFRAEARTMATISHPGVVEVYDFGDDPAAGVYLVMKYIDGESLAHTLARAGRLSAETTMLLVTQAAEALHAAHDRGVTHRDVKPGNLLLRPDGSALLTDFGIARSAQTTGQSTTGSLVGTAGYFAPERVTGWPATARSDIYSLGVVAYQCLAGHLPFEGESLVEIALRHVHDEPPPLPPHVPPGVRSVVERAMAKDPAQRWPSGAALAAAARTALTPPPHHTETPPPHRAVTTPTPPRHADMAPTPPWRRAGTAPSPLPHPEMAPPPRHPEAAPSRHAEAAPPPHPEMAPLAPPRQVGMAAVVTQRPGTVPETGEQMVSSARGARRLRVPAVAVLVVAIIATVSHVLRNGDTSQPQGRLDKPGATVDATQAASPGASHPVPSAAPATPVAVPGAATPKAGAANVAPASPKNLTATPIDSGTIRLRWSDDSANEEGFTIINGATSREVGANAASYDWAGLAPETYQCFKIRAFNPWGTSDYHPAAAMEWVCATSLTGVGPAAPANLSATALNSSTVRLQWTDNSADENGFTITNGATSRNTAANATTFDWAGLSPNTHTCFKVRSFHATGASPYHPAAEQDWVCITTPAG